MTDKFEIKINDKNELIFVKCGDFDIIGVFNDWHNRFYVTRVLMTIKKQISDPNTYSIFHSNYCSQENKFEIHVAVTGFSDELTLPHKVKNVGVDFCLEPNSNSKVDVEVFLYDISLRCEDKKIYKCGKRTDEDVEPYKDEVCNKIKLFTSSVDPIPERRGKSILVGKT